MRHFYINEPRKIFTSKHAAIVLVILISMGILLVYMADMEADDAIEEQFLVFDSQYPPIPPPKEFPVIKPIPSLSPTVYRATPIQIKPLLSMVPTRSNTTEIKCKIVRMSPRICAPQFMIIGAMDSHTHLLAHGLEGLELVKVLYDICFFSDDHLWQDVGPNGYWSNYRGLLSTMNGELCNSYMKDFSTKTAGRMHVLMPGTKIVAVLPSPIERFERHAMRMNLTPDRAWVMYGKSEMEAAYNCRRQTGSDSICLMRLTSQFTGLVLYGMYHKLIRPYEQRFGNGNVMIIDEHRLLYDHDMVMAEVLHHIGAPGYLFNKKPLRINDHAEYLSEPFRTELAMFYAIM